MMLLSVLIVLIPSYQTIGLWAPLLVLMVAVLGWWLDREMLQTSLITQIGHIVGQQGAEALKAAIASSQQPGQGLLASLLAFALLLVGATGVFAELQSAFERLWTQGTGVAAAQAVLIATTGSPDRASARLVGASRGAVALAAVAVAANQYGGAAAGAQIASSRQLHWSPWPMGKDGDTPAS